MISTSVSNVIVCSAMLPHSRGMSGSMGSFGLSGGHHRHTGDPAGDSLVELLLHGEVAAGRERPKGCYPCEDFVGTATCGLTHLVGIERICARYFAASQDIHELPVPFRIERLARSLARLGENACLKHALLTRPFGFRGRIAS